MLWFFSSQDGVVEHSNTGKIVLGFWEDFWPGIGLSCLRVTSSTRIPKVCCDYWRLSFNGQWKAGQGRYKVGAFLHHQAIHRPQWRDFPLCRRMKPINADPASRSTAQQHLPGKAPEVQTAGLETLLRPTVAVYALSSSQPTTKQVLAHQSKTPPL